jgi:hypothetical protein
LILFLNFWKKKILNWIFENFWIFVRCHPSVLSHHALGTAECDESYCIEGTIFGRSFVGVPDFVYHESYCDESGIMTIYGFQFFCDVSSGGWRRVLIWFLECIKNHTSYYFQYKVDNSQFSSFIGIFSDHMNNLWFAKMSSL